MSSIVVDAAVGVSVAVAVALDAAGASSPACTSSSITLKLCDAPTRTA